LAYNKKDLSQADLLIFLRAIINFSVRLLSFTCGSHILQSGVSFSETPNTDQTLTGLRTAVGTRDLVSGWSGINNTF